MIDSIDTLKQLIPTVVGTELDKYRQPINDAQAWLEGIIGSELFDKAEQEEASGGELFVRAQLVVACKAYLIAIPKLDILETNNGFAVINDQKYAPASRERVNALTASFAESLDMALGRLIEYLEDSDAYRSLWCKAPMCTIMFGSYLPTLREFRKFGTFEGGYIDFIGARASVRSIILKHIEPRISRALSDRVVAEVQSGTISLSVRSILDDLCYTLTGFYVGDTMLAITSLCRIREVLEAHPDDYPEFRDSEIYQTLLRQRRQQEDQKYLPILPIL